RSRDQAAGPASHSQAAARWIVFGVRFMSEVLERPSHVFNAAAVRRDFPILATEANGQPLVYLDSAASTQKPQQVIDAQSKFYEDDYANIHRGIYELSQRATSLHDAARRKAQHLLGARDWREIIFTRNATESINLVAQSFLRPKLEPGDEILVTEMEHHANIVPWQLVAEATSAKVIASPITDEGELDYHAFLDRLGPRTKMVGLAWISNVLGTVNPVEDIIAEAHRRHIPVLIDAAQAVQHRPVDVATLDADFVVCSGHKMYGPSGVGLLYGKAEILEAMPPYQGGGDMIETVRFEGTTFNDIPYRFEAGTPDIAGIVAFGHAIDYMQTLGLEAIEAHEADLLAYATRALMQVPGLEMIGTAPEKCSVMTFKLAGIHPQDIGTLLDLDGIAIRTGHHCAQPLHHRLGMTASARASIGLYNTTQDIDALVTSLKRIAAKFG
ncbi:MAG: cysteine desulfurase, partial [Pseudomonadota bacterium]